MKKIYFSIVLGILLVFCTPIYAIDLTQYCSDGYYKIPNEPTCSRAPGCKSGNQWTYDALNTQSKMPNAQQCMGDGEAGRAKKGCAGYVPLCCYEVARTGDFTKCIGYWERLWCTASQCNEAKKNGASNSQCGGDCQCGHAFSSYCGNKQAVPLEQRLGGSVVQPPPVTIQPTNTPTPVNSQNPTIVPTLIPTITSSPIIGPSRTPTRLPIQFPTKKPTVTPITQSPFTPSPTVIQAVTASPTVPIEPPNSIQSTALFIQQTEKILQAPEQTYRRVLMLDRQIEQTFEDWFGRLFKKIIELSNYQFSEQQ